jgi:hypothetical protein
MAVARLRSRSVDGEAGTRPLQRLCCRRARRLGSSARPCTIGWTAGWADPQGRIRGGVPGALAGAGADCRVRSLGPTASRPQPRNDLLRAAPDRETPSRAATREGEPSGARKPSRSEPRGGLVATARTVALAGTLLFSARMWQGVGPPRQRPGQRVGATVFRLADRRGAKRDGVSRLPRAGDISERHCS